MSDDAGYQFSKSKRGEAEVQGAARSRGGMGLLPLPPWGYSGCGEQQ